MEVRVEVKEYVDGEALSLSWQSGYKIAVAVAEREIVVKANRAGLISLAAHLLTLAQENVPPGYHLHLDDSNSLEDGSASLVLERE